MAFSFLYSFEPHTKDHVMEYLYFPWIWHFLFTAVSYVAEYKEARQTWDEARKRYWFQEAGGTFELGNLEPWTSYNIRSAQT